MKCSCLFLVVLCSCSYVLKQDGPVEEIVEDVIQYETGINIDLSSGVENAVDKVKK